MYENEPLQRLRRFQGTGPRTVQIEAQNSAGVKAQVEARYPGAYNITLSQLPTSAKKKRE